MSRRVCIIDDDVRLIEVMARFLASHHYRVSHPAVPFEIETLEGELPDVILLDWMLPGISGIDLLKRIRSSKLLALVPVIMLTARNEEVDKLQGLLSGADDYVTKPFSFAELEARINSVLRRAARVAPTYTDEYLEIVPLRKRLRVKGEPRHLSQYEWAALELLLLSDGTVSREDLMRHVFGETPPSSVRSIDNLILKLRKIVEPEELPRYILSDRGLGYRFVRYDTRRNA